MIGFERPPLAEFKFQFDAYTKLACIDPENPRNPCLNILSTAPTSTARFPNRPNPPDPDRTIEVFAPVQSSQFNSISQNAGADYFNADASSTDRHVTRLLQDVNGDGFPDVISDGVAELTSPVGLPRRDWWTYFRLNPGASTPKFPLEVGGFEQSGHSASGGLGAGLSASTLRRSRGRNRRARRTPMWTQASASVSKKGHDDRFTDLRDFNGDGLADIITVGTANPSNPNGELLLHFNTGDGLRADGTDVFRAADVTAVPFNTTHSSGFGVRLGFSIGAGSFAAGAGLAHRDAGSQAALIDFNGDGRPDIVLPVGDSTGDLKVYLNLGKRLLGHAKDPPSDKLDVPSAAGGRGRSGDVSCGNDLGGCGGTVDLRIQRIFPEDCF